MNLNSGSNMKKSDMNEIKDRQNELKGKLGILIFVFISICLTHLPGVSNASTIQWQFRAQFGESDSSPAVGDLDDDGVLDLVFCSTSGRIFALDANGRQKWYFDTGQTISNAPTLTDLNTKRPKVFAITNPGKIFCLDGESGSRLWDYTMPAAVDWGSTLIASANLDKNEGTEIVVADKKGNLVCLNDQGSQIWTTKYKNGFNSAPAIADLYGDGDLEILIGTTVSPLVCFSGKGKELWRLNESGSVGSSPLVCDLNHDKKPDILVGQNQGLTMVDNRGKVQWHYEMRKNIHDAIAVGDINNDGMEEIIVVDLFGKTACLDYSGKLLWTANVEQRVRRSPAIADLDGDFVPEIIIGGYSAALHIFDTDGNLKERKSLNRAMNSSPTVVDFRGDQNLSLIVAAETDITAFTWLDGKPEGRLPVLWGEYRGNSARSGSVVKRTKSKDAQILHLDYGGLYVGSNVLQVHVANPKKQSLSIDLEIKKNSERPLTASYTFSDTIFNCRLPYTIIGKAAVNMNFRIQLRSGKQILANRNETFYLVPFARDLADLQQTCSVINELIPNLTDPTYARDQVTILKARLLTFEKQTKLAGTLSPLERSSLRDNLKDLRNKADQLKAMTKLAVKAGTVIAVYEANPWSPFGGRDEIFEERTKKSDLKIEAFGGETESAALNLANFSSQPLTIRIEVDPLLSLQDSSRISARGILTLHEVLDVPTQALDLSADALPLLGQAQTIVVPAWNVRQVWLTVNSSGLNPGEWEGNLRFRALDVSASITEAEILPNGMGYKITSTAGVKTLSLGLCTYINFKGSGTSSFSGSGKSWYECICCNQYLCTQGKI